MAYAHSANAAGQRHDLLDHLRSVAEQAADFAASFGGGELARWAGLWHDLGKFHPDFQAYLSQAEAGGRQRGPDHKGAGAIVASRHCPPLSMLVQGHHGGLPDRAEVPGWLRERAADRRTGEAMGLALAAGAAVEPAGALTPPPHLGQHDTELFLRLVFSALVDADFLDTERHFQAGRAAVREGAPALTTLWQEFAAAQARLTGRKDDSVNRVRHAVYEACLAAAEQSPGFFRLTVPTGGGKTLSGLAFALRHALAHGLRRIVVAIPYTSITDQTAAVYRGIFADERAVLEHHSAVQWPEPPDGEPTPDWGRLATENWEAPIVVTTTVQLFQSLFGNSPTACRKLHNLAGSVVILDEAQTLPTGLLTPILDVLRALVEHARVSVVLCTATQPALDPRAGFPGLPGIRDIIPDATPLIRSLRRVDYTLPVAGERWTWERAAEVIRAEPRSLTILNTKRDALALLDALADPEALHLSTLLCGAHRRAVLAEVRRRLTTGAPCRLISTQVVEAGVDLDFPVVLRALGPLDRIIQAAGRCNREGLLPAGRVIVFEPAEGRLPRGDYQTATDTTAIFLRDSTLDLHDPAAITTYFRRFYGNVNLDSKGIQALRAAFDYPAVAERARLIDDDASPVVVPYPPAVAEIDALLARLRAQPTATRNLLRRLQPYAVAIASRECAAYQRQGLLSEVIPGLWQWHGGYDLTRGLVPGAADPDRLIV
jgi:CRISPR-associated endonuclease/helicase Cas3